MTSTVRSSALPLVKTSAATPSSSILPTDSVVFTYHGFGFECDIELPATPENLAKGADLWQGSVWRRTK